MAGALDDCLEPLERTLEAGPPLASVIFASARLYVAVLHDVGIVAATQVQDLVGIVAATQVQDSAGAVAAAEAGVDILVSQGTDAGGHTGTVGTLPLHQLVRDAVDVPVVAAGGIATARGPGTGGS